MRPALEHGIARVKLNDCPARLDQRTRFPVERGQQTIAGEGVVELIELVGNRLYHLDSPLSGGFGPAVPLRRALLPITRIIVAGVTL